MSKLVWDAVGEKIFETGVNHGVLFVQNSDGTYKNGVVWNGLTGVTESPDGAEPTDLWADNIKYASLRSAETFGATIEAYTYPDEFYECDGSATVADGVYFGQQSRTPFGFTYRTEVGSDTIAADSDTAYKIHIIYNATASPSERAYETINDSPDAITFSWEVTTTPVPVTGYKPVSSITIDTLKLNDSTKLKAIEDLLYGTANAESTLPTPAQILGIVGGSSTTTT